MTWNGWGVLSRFSIYLDASFPLPDPILRTTTQTQQGQRPARAGPAAAPRIRPRQCPYIRQHTPKPREARLIVLITTTKTHTHTLQQPDPWHGLQPPLPVPGTTLRSHLRLLATHALLAGTYVHFHFFSRRTGGGGICLWPELEKKEGWHAL